MNRTRKIFNLLLLALSLLFLFNSYSNITVEAKDIYNGETLEVSIKDTRDFRGVWVSALVSDIPRFSSITQYQSAITNVLNNMEKYNLNTLVFHIRIYNDAFYESKYNQYSSLYRTNATWDPLPWIIDECHKRGIEFHAWMNPYRVSTSTSTSLDKIAAKFDSSNAASNPGNLLTGNTYVILNPGLPNVQSFLVDVVMEVVENYDVDAIHFDDYFYTAGVDDSLTYKLYGSEYSKITDFRRASVSKLIELLHNSISSYNLENNKAVKLGISPTAIYRCGDGNVTYDKNGHAITNGAAMSSYFDQHYESACADTLLWIQNGWIDYIVPQLYVDGDQFRIMSTWWDKVVKNEKCLFVAGITNFSCDWEHFKTLNNPGGICLFSYKSLSALMENSGAKEYLKEKALPRINYTNQFDDSSFEAAVVKVSDGYKLAIKKTNDAVNWYQVTNSLNDKSYNNLTNTSTTLIDNRNFNESLIYTITPILKNGEIGTSVKIKVSEALKEINFYDDQNNLIESQYLNIGDEIIYPNLKESDSLDYYWDNDSKTVTENLDIHMKSKEKMYTITYMDPDGNIITTQKYKFGESLTLPEIPESKKYDYSKWKVNGRYTVSKDDTILLSYKLINYKLNVYGNYKILLSETVHYGDDLKELLNKITNYNTKEGYTFIGFDNQSDTVTGDMTINALYQVNEYTITYLDGEEVLKVETYKYKDEVILDNSFTKEGYKLEGFIYNNEIITKISSLEDNITVNCNFVKDGGCKTTIVIFEMTFLLALLFIIRKNKGY